MFKDDLHELGFEYTKYWHDIKKQLEKEIKGNVIIKYDNEYDQIKVIIMLKEINYNTSFYFPYDFKDLKKSKDEYYNIIKMIKQNLQFKIYESIFYIDTNEVG